MKRIFYPILVMITAGIFIKCQKELSVSHTIPQLPNNQSSPITATLQGNVLEENGEPAAGVKISVGSKTATTNSHGYFRITDAPLDKNASLAIAELPGYFRSYRSFRATTGVNQVVIKLIKKTLAGSINSITGGDVIMANGAKVSLPANGITSAAGGAYAGNIKVYASYIDPASKDIGKTVPGSFMGDDKNNNRVVLSSYGMLAVELESASGEKLQIQDGRVATLTIPIPSSIVSSAPASISLWYIDEQTGVWKEQGTAKKSGSNYTGEVKHFSFWNCDISTQAINFSAIFKTSDGRPLTNTSVVIRAIADTLWGYGQGYTDSLGQVSGLIPANRSLVLEVFDQCYNVVYSKNIGPFMENTDLGSIIIPNTGQSFITVKGKLLSCGNTPVSDGYAIIYWDNFVSIVSADGEGKFSTNIIICSTTPQTFEILGVDRAAQQQAALVTIPVAGKVADAGNISVCGSTTAQFINYTLDGTELAISNSINDSLVAYTFAAGTLFNTYVQGIHSLETQRLYFDFTGKAEEGVYPLNALYVTPYDRIGLTKPFKVTVTSYPQHPGEFYEGNFSGGFVDSSAISIKHTISCSFRIRKY